MKRLLPGGMILATLVAGLLTLPAGISAGAHASSDLSTKSFAPHPTTSTCAQYCIVANISVGSGPAGMAIDSANGYLYVANFNSNNVTIINTSTDSVTGSIAVGTNPWGAHYDASNKKVYITNNNFVSQSTVDVISGTSVVANVTVGSGSQEMAQNSSGFVYVSNTVSSNISVINPSTDTVSATITGGGLNWPVGEAQDTRSGDIYVANYASATSGTVTVINGTSPSTLIGGLGSYPQGVAYDHSNNFVYVTNEYSGNVSVINASTNQVIGSITTGGVPVGITCNQSSGEIYVADENGTNQITVISGLKVVAQIAIANGKSGTNGPQDDFVLYDSSNRQLYSTDYAAGRVYAISTKVSDYGVRYIQSGLPSGTEWWVNISNGQSIHSTGTSLSLKESNGTYTFKIVSANKLYAVRYHGTTFTIAGHSVVRRVDFHLVSYQVTLTEKGLPIGTKWWVNLTNGQSFGSNRSVISFLEANGTYPYLLASANPTYTAAGGSLLVHGSKLAVSIRFS